MLLKTERLILKNFEESDLELFSSLMSDPEVMRFSISGPLSKEQSKENFHKRILSHYQKYGYGLLAVFLQSNEEFIGFVGLIRQTIDSIDEIELGYRIFPKFWNQGFATEAAAVICNHAFQTLKVKRLVSIIDPKNYRSQKVAKKLGMHLWKRSVFHEIPVDIYSLGDDKIEHNA